MTQSIDSPGGLHLSCYGQVIVVINRSTAQHVAPKRFVTVTVSSVHRHLLVTNATVEVTVFHQQVIGNRCYWLDKGTS